MPPCKSCLSHGLAYPEVTQVICRVPSEQLSQAPWYTLPTHLCRFRVRTIMLGLFPGCPSQPDQSNKIELLTATVTSNRLRNINRITIDYAFRPRLRLRLTLRGLALRRNPWVFGERVSHSLYRYSCQNSHFRYLQRPSQVRLRRPTERSTTMQQAAFQASVSNFSPGTSSARELLFRPVSYYAFFK